MVFFAGFLVFSLAISRRPLLFVGDNLCALANIAGQTGQPDVVLSVRPAPAEREYVVDRPKSGLSPFGGTIDLRATVGAVAVRLGPEKVDIDAASGALPRAPPMRALTVRLGIGGMPGALPDGATRLAQVGAPIPVGDRLVELAEVLDLAAVGALLDAQDHPLSEFLSGLLQACHRIPVRPEAGVMLGAQLARMGSRLAAVNAARLPLPPHRHERFPASLLLVVCGAEVYAAHRAVAFGASACAFHD